MQYKANDARKNNHLRPSRIEVVSVQIKSRKEKSANLAREHQAGLEPVTLGLGSRCSAIELLMHILVFPSRQSLCEIPLMNLSRDGLCRYIARKIRRPIVLCSHNYVLASRITHLPRQGHTLHSRTLH